MLIVTLPIQGVLPRLGADPPRESPCGLRSAPPLHENQKRHPAKRRVSRLGSLRHALVTLRN
jgi:hypothetical protein